VKVEEGAEGTEQSPIEVRKDEAMSEDFAHNACNGVTENDMRRTKISTGIKTHTISTGYCLPCLGAAADTIPLVLIEVCDRTSCPAHQSLQEAMRLV
jgi:hypothetical protein